MPYIRQEDKHRLGGFPVPETPGELNFAVTTLVLNYLESQDKVNYQAINDVVGALEGAKIEFYRRVAAPYEDAKIEENGDVY